MPNIFDYLKWRDLKLEKVEFTEVDNLILSRLAYFPLDNAVEDKEITIKNAYEKYLTVKHKGRILQEEDSQLFPLLANSIRFGKLKLTEYVNKIDLNNEEQFSAVTILMPNGMIYISYRGTDNTIVGWKEDLNMSFKELVPAQTTAKNYLNKIAEKYKDKQIIVGGHSKGGNLAVYAAAYCEPKIQERIIKVYNNDGPGFCDKVVNSEEYNRILNKVHTYIPKSSIIGRLLNHKEETTILESTETGIMQHDLYTWQLIGGNFIKAELTNSSEFIDKTLTDLLLNVSVEQRSLCIDVLFEVLKATKAETLSEINENKFSNIITMIKTYKNLDEENKEIVTKVLNVLLKIGRSNIGKKE